MSSEVRSCHTNDSLQIHHEDSRTLSPSSDDVKTTSTAVSFPMGARSDAPRHESQSCELNQPSQSPAISSATTVTPASNGNNLYQSPEHSPATSESADEISSDHLFCHPQARSQSTYMQANGLHRFGPFFDDRHLERSGYSSTLDENGLGGQNRGERQNSIPFGSQSDMETSLSTLGQQEHHHDAESLSASSNGQLGLSLDLSQSLLLQRPAAGFNYLQQNVLGLAPSEGGQQVTAKGFRDPTSGVLLSHHHFNNFGQADIIDHLSNETSIDLYNSNNALNPALLQQSMLHNRQFALPLPQNESAPSALFPNQLACDSFPQHPQFSHLFDLQPALHSPPFIDAYSPIATPGYARSHRPSGVDGSFSPVVLVNGADSRAEAAESGVSMLGQTLLQRRDSNFQSDSSNNNNNPSEANSISEFTHASSGNPLQTQMQPAEASETSVSLGETSNGMSSHRSRNRRPSTTNGSTSVLGALLQRLFALHSSAENGGMTVKTQRKADAIAYAVDQLSTEELLQLLKNVLAFQNTKKAEQASRCSGWDWHNDASQSGQTNGGNASSGNGTDGSSAGHRERENDGIARIFASDDIEVITDELSALSGIPDKKFLQAIAVWCRQESPLKHPLNGPTSLSSTENGLIGRGNNLGIPVLNLNSPNKVAPCIGDSLVDFEKGDVAGMIEEGVSSSREHRPCRNCALGSSVLPLGALLNTLMTKIDTLQAALRAQVELQANTLTALVDTQMLATKNLQSNPSVRDVGSFTPKTLRQFSPTKDNSQADSVLNDIQRASTAASVILSPDDSASFNDSNPSANESPISPFKRQRCDDHEFSTPTTRETTPKDDSCQQSKRIRAEEGGEASINVEPSTASLLPKMPHGSSPNVKLEIPSVVTIIEGSHQATQPSLLNSNPSLMLNESAESEVGHLTSAGAGIAPSWTPAWPPDCSDQDAASATAVTVTTSLSIDIAPFSTCSSLQQSNSVSQSGATGNNPVDVCEVKSEDGPAHSTQSSIDMNSHKQCLLQLQALALAAPQWANHCSSFLWHKQHLECGELQPGEEEANVDSSNGVSNTTKLREKRTNKYLRLFLDNINSSECVVLESYDDIEMHTRSSQTHDVQKVSPLISRQAISFLCPYDNNAKLREAWEISSPQLYGNENLSGDLKKHPSQVNQLGLRLQQVIEFIPLWISRLDTFRKCRDPSFHPLTALPPQLQSAAFSQFFSTYVSASSRQLKMLEIELSKSLKESLDLFRVVPCNSCSSDLVISSLMPNASDVAEGTSFDNGSELERFQYSSGNCTSITSCGGQMTPRSGTARNDSKHRESSVSSLYNHLKCTTPSTPMSPKGMHSSEYPNIHRPTSLIGSSKPDNLLSILQRHRSSYVCCDTEGNGTTSGTSSSTLHNTSLVNAPTGRKMMLMVCTAKPTAACSILTREDEEDDSMGDMQNATCKLQQSPWKVAPDFHSVDKINFLKTESTIHDSKQALANAISKLNIGLSTKSDSTNCLLAAPNDYPQQQAQMVPHISVAAPTIPVFSTSPAVSAMSPNATSEDKSSSPTTPQRSRSTQQARGGRSGGIQGVVWKPEEDTWVAFWQDPTTSQQQIRRFPVAQFGADTARKMAVKCRREADKQLTAAVLVNRSNTGTSMETSAPNADLPRSEVPGVYWYRNRNGWVAQWFENGKNKHKFFAASVFGVEGAKQKAIAYRLMKLEEKKLNGW